MGFDAPRFTGACSGLTFRRVEGLILSKAYKRLAETFATEVAVAKALIARVAVNSCNKRASLP